MAQNILIDTDLGDDVDDILAIAFALRRPELDVKAITTVTYGSEKRTYMMRKLLDIMNRNEIPVAAGIQLPLRSLNNTEIQAMMDHKGYVLNQYPFVKETDSKYKISGRADGLDAIGVMEQMVEKYPGDITIVCIGPLTNLATFLRRRPDLAHQISSIAIMGGEVLLNRREHNMAYDPCAADIVFTSGIPIFMGTWDVTRHFVLTEKHCEIIKNHGSPLCDAISECIGLWWPFKNQKPGPIMYDIAPIIWSFDRTYYEIEPMDIRIETLGEYSKGMTIRRWGQPNADVTVNMKEDQVLQLFMDTICGDRIKDNKN